MSESQKTPAEQSSEYIKKRLDSLDDIDQHIVSFLGNMSETVDTLQRLKQTNDTTLTDKFKHNVNDSYADLSFAATHLRREIRFLGRRMQSHKNEDGFTMLPAQISKKATWVNNAKLREEIHSLDELLGKNNKDIKAESDKHEVKKEIDKDESGDGTKEDKQDKKEIKEETHEEAHEETKEESKDETKEQVKEEPKDEIKEEPKEVQDETTKSLDDKEGKTGDEDEMDVDKEPTQDQDIEMK